MSHRLFLKDGFANVTIDDIAAAAGVHRTTFLRYFRTKEDVVVGFWDSLSEFVCGELRDRPADEDDWTALRRAFAVCLEQIRDDMAGGLALTSLIYGTPSLWAKQLEKQHNWNLPLARSLVQRQGSSEEPALGQMTMVAAALSCLNLGLQQWIVSHGEHDPEDLVDDAFNALIRATRTSRLQSGTKRRLLASRAP